MRESNCQFAGVVLDFCFQKTYCPSASISAFLQGKIATLTASWIKLEVFVTKFSNPLFVSPENILVWPDIGSVILLFSIGKKQSARELGSCINVDFSFGAWASGREAYNLSMISSGMAKEIFGLTF